MTQDEVDQVSTNPFEHPTLDLHSIFLDFRSSGVLTQDTTLIKNFLQECQNDIGCLDTKIKDTISTIARLSRDLTEASVRMTQRASQVRLCEHLLSPLEHLPQDVLEQIFLFSLTSVTKDTEPHPNHAPLQLAAVCRRWRTIALSMPTLWNGLTVSSVGGVELAKTWVGRCYRPSLTLHLKRSIPPSNLRELFAVLRGPSLGLRKIDVDVLRDVVKEFLLEYDLPAIEELVLRGYPDVLPSLPPSTSLRRLYMHKPPASWLHYPPPSQLTVLWLTSKIHWNTFVIFLTSCPNLESLYVCLNEEGLRLDPEPQDFESRDRTLPQLTYLGVFWDSDRAEEPPEDLLRWVAFPSLRIFEYYHSKKSNPGSGFFTCYIPFIDLHFSSTMRLHQITSCSCWSGRCPSRNCLSESSLDSCRIS
ncbi:hypothetical protein BDN72DRAFT_838429 [Pluteus cervinus]|uniref:Uncharacterized protein n=1 Tax=Pluteus cervinus TaxID=181527 RepID=A0ACD3AYY2_9AGAR|nr:hypothetical protein BDN72DRAFT_838429 [Pluteus cervinus]